MSTPRPGRKLRSAIFHALRAGFRALPISEATRDALRNRFLDRFPTIRPLQPQGQATPAMERRPRVHSGGRAIGYVERRDEPLPNPLPATLVAFYLPQFHTIPENDEWWGKGFTEWRNVARALPQFEGHHQPRLPGDLGFYDLRNPQVLRDQAELAQAYGISAFCMYFYWFGGKTLLELPHQQWLNDPSITLPICLCWANENWTRTWDGRAEEVLIAQQHSPEDDLAFIAHVAQYLRDPRYLRVDGKPLLLLYRPGKLPDPKATAERWRAWCRENGIGEICLAYVQSFERPDPRDIGFDAAVEFPPNLSTATNITARQTLLNPEYEGEVLDWRDVARDFSTRPMPEYHLFPGVSCGWDNEARRPGRGRTYIYSAPRHYRDWLSNAVRERLASVLPTDRLVFLNAWNEWAEGALLEPDATQGYAFLQATRDGILASRQSIGRPIAIVHAWHVDVLDELLDSLDRLPISFRRIVTTAPERADDVRTVLKRRADAAELRVFANRGRDVLPFLHVLGSLPRSIDAPVLKLHTKRSFHLADGDGWRRSLLQRILEPSVIAAALDPKQRASSTLTFPPSLRFESSQAGYGNDDTLANLCNRTGLVVPTTFAAGSMFWTWTSSMLPIVEAGLSSQEFEAEDGQIDGTLAHAIERLISA